ncbi:hypothetical protein ABDI30_10755 [Paenibacillus cisolokensis]|uniref:hypothetical protein n=1 Tax=Paenibacillus cisolokensis TaxID=1658519 RepID=UPI003D2D6D01
MTDRNDLNLFVDRLFANKRKTKAVMELKQEILSNLEAKVADCMSSGYGLSGSHQSGDPGSGRYRQHY